MKEHRIVTSNAPVTCLLVDGTPHHYFHSEKLGKCRAIQIAENENLEPGSKHYATKPLSKGEKLEMLMDCGERLQKRYWLFWAEYDALPESDRKSRNAIFAKMENVHRASNRITQRICHLLVEKR